MKRAGSPLAGPALVVAVGLLLSVQSVGATDAKAGAPSAPGVGPSAAALHPARRGAQVVCYVETLFGGVRVSGLDLGLCTVVTDAFALPDAKGGLQLASGLPRRELVRAAHALRARALLSVGGATVPAKTFTALARDAAARGRLFEALGRVLLDGGYDGVDLDWEFPAPAERELFTGFAGELRAALVALFEARRPGEQPMLVLGLSPADAIEAYDFPKLAKVADLFVQFGYDFRNPALGPWASGKKLWPDGSSRPIEASVRGVASELVRRGLPREKLVIGLPLYASDGRPWVDIRAKALAGAHPVQPQSLESEVDGAWVTGPEAIAAKARKVLAGDEIDGGGAAGVALWQLGHQGKTPELTEALRRALPPGAARRPVPRGGRR